MRAVLFLMLSMATQIAHAVDGMPTRAGERGSIETRSSDNQVQVSWPLRFAPGDDVVVATTTDKRNDVIYVRRYVALGVVGGSLNIQVLLDIKRKDQQSSKADFLPVRTLYVERTGVGSFFFSPEETRGEGYFRITRISDSSPYYAVTYVKEFQ